MATDDLHTPLPDETLDGSHGAEDLEDLALSDDYALNPRYAKMVMEAADRGNTAPPYATQSSRRARSSASARSAREPIRPAASNRDGFLPRCRPSTPATT